MTAAQFAPTAPTDPQLALIAKLAHENGWDEPAAVYSKEEASMMCACDADFTCARCRRREREDDAETERFEEMLYALGWEDRAVPALADYEAPA